MKILGEVVGSITEKKIETRNPSRNLSKILYEGCRTRVHVIAEIKPKTPKKGHIQDKDLNYDTITQAYNRGLASAISVLVEEEYFGGSFDLLRNIREKTDLPILAKGFFLTLTDIARCAAAGADAYLLMVRVLNAVNSDLEQMISFGRKLGLEPVVEVASIDELQYAIDMDAKIIAVNSRNIYSDLSIDLTNISIAKELPMDIVLIGASGINSTDDIRKVWEISEYRIDAVLVGTSLMKSSDPEKSLRGFVKTGSELVRLRSEPTA